jgi:hypothetical protein
VSWPLVPPIRRSVRYHVACRRHQRRRAIHVQIICNIYKRWLFIYLYSLAAVLSPDDTRGGKICFRIAFLSWPVQRSRCSCSLRQLPRCPMGRPRSLLQALFRRHYTSHIIMTRLRPQLNPSQSFLIPFSCAYMQLFFFFVNRSTH